MPEQDPPDHELILSKYRQAPLELEEALAGITPRDLEVEAHPGGWTVRELVHHISDGDDLWKACILAGLGGATPVFTLDWYWSLPQDSWSKWWHYAERSVEDSLAMFQANRHITTHALGRSPNWWAKRVAIKSLDGTLETHTILQVVASQANHAIQHLKEIKEALAKCAKDEGRAA